MNRKPISRHKQIERLIDKTIEEQESIILTFLQIEEFLKSKKTDYTGQSEITDGGIRGVKR